MMSNGAPAPVSSSTRAGTPAAPIRPSMTTKGMPFGMSKGMASIILISNHSIMMEHLNQTE
jgi:hypothetical protein